MWRVADGVVRCARPGVRWLHPARGGGQRPPHDGQPRQQQQQQRTLPAEGSADRRVEERRRERDGVRGPATKSHSVPRHSMGKPQHAPLRPVEASLRGEPFEPLVTFVGWAEWTRDGRHPHTAQDRAMDDACARQHGHGVRAATWSEYHHNLVAGAPATNLSELWLHFTGEEGWGYDNGKGYQWKKCLWRNRNLNGGFTEDSCSASICSAMAVRPIHP